MAETTPPSSPSCVRPPPPLLFNSVDMSKGWKQFKQQFEWFSIATQLNKKDNEIQVATFMSSIGYEAIEIFNTFNLSDDDVKDIGKIKEHFEKYFAPKISITFERYVFNKLCQVEGETFDEFLTKVKSQGKKCNFGILEDSLVRDKIIVGILSDVMREKLLAEDDITLDKTVTTCRTSEAASRQINQMKTSNNNNVDAINKHQYKRDNSQPKNNKSVNNSKNRDSEVFDCKRCGTTHGRRNCPAFRQNCKKCNGKGHFGKMCRSSKKQTNEVIVEDSNSTNSDNDKDVFVESVHENNHDDNKNWYEEIKIATTNVKVKLDTGAQCNVLPKRIVDKINIRIQPSNAKHLTVFNNEKLNVIGEIKTKCVVRDENHQIKFLVVNANVSPILGKQACENLKLVLRVQELKVQEEIFDGLGCIKNYIYDIDLVEDPKFEIQPVRKVPLAIKQQVKKEIDSMVELGVLEKTHEVTQVVSPMVIVKKNDKLRVCIDPTDVNKNIIRRYHPLKTAEEIMSKIQKSKYFTILDCKRGFWQIQVSPRTQKYLTMGTPWGRYSFKRLPFGLASAPEVFQDVMGQILSSMENVENSMDDILIHAETLEQLERLTSRVIKKLMVCGVKLNKDKCIFNSQKVKFLGHIFSVNGLLVDPEKTKAIRQLNKPNNVNELQRLLGMATYLSKFVPNLSGITQPLRLLLEKNSEWIWTDQHEEAFRSLKEAFSSPPVLKFFDTNQEVTIQVDASYKSFGAALLQNGQPIAFASKSLTKAQQRYPPIELEAAAVRWACTKFHEYVYGKKLTVQSDHKPLEIIFKKSLTSAPARLQRILFDVKQYSPTIIYKKGTTMDLADTLSRDCKSDSVEEEEEFQVYLVLNMSNSAKAELVEATRNDHEIQELIKISQSGWPEDTKVLSEVIKPYHNFREEIAYYNGIAFKGMKIIVPKSQIKKMLKAIHLGHFGITRCCSRARQMFYWRGMTKDIADYVNSCAVCQQNQTSKQKEPLINKQVPEYPFEIVATDLFHFQGNEYLLLVDSYSGFFDFKLMSRINSDEVIKELKSWFSVHGIPEILESDNGTQYTSEKFQKFTRDWSITQQFSSPKYARSNGLAERFVETAKNLLTKCSKDDTDVYLALLNYRNMPRDEHLQSPNQRLFSRVTRSTIPTSKELLKPVVVKNVSERLTILRKIQKQYADQNSKSSEEFKPGDAVRIQLDHRKWVSGKIKSLSNAPRSYIVETADGSVLRRNSKHIAKCKASIQTPTEIVVMPSQSNSNGAEQQTQIIIQMPNEDNDRSNNLDNSNSKANENTVNNRVTNNAGRRSELQTSRYGRIIKPVKKLDL